MVNNPSAEGLLTEPENYRSRRFRGLRALGVNIERLLSPRAAVQSMGFPEYREAAIGQKRTFRNR
jgi:hypothetical protein